MSKQLRKIAEQKKNLTAPQLYVYLIEQGIDVKFGNVLQAVRARTKREKYEKTRIDTLNKAGCKEE